MSQRLLGMLVAIAFAILTPYVNAGTQHGCGQVANPCGDCYGGSVVDPAANGGADAATLVLAYIAAFTAAESAAEPEESCISDVSFHPYFPVTSNNRYCLVPSQSFGIRTHPIHLREVIARLMTPKFRCG